mmetsp:Transcript_265/g.912  ORF Transcript_265/g.912 Transcript_265/m.912 type:complete len:254 (+) Transcript_265:95-856(+)
MAATAAEEAGSLASPLVAPDVERPNEAVPSALAAPPAELAQTPPASGEEDGAQDHVCLDAVDIEEAIRVMRPLVEECRHRFTAVQPWREFARFTWPRSFGEVCSRVKSNARTYWANYTVIALVCLGAAVVMCPPTLIVALLLAFVWSVVLKRMDDPAWKVKIGSLELGKEKQLALFGAVTVLAALLFVAPLLVAVVPSCIPVILAHTAMHPAVGERCGPAPAKLAASPGLESGVPAREVALRGEAEAATDSAE